MKHIIRIAAVILAAVMIFAVVDRLPSAAGELSTIAASTKVTSDGKYSGSLILVNDKHRYRNTGEEFVKLYDEKTDSFFMGSTEIMLSKIAVKPLCDMFDAFRNETGLKKINVISGYRSVESQQEIYKQKANRYGNLYAKKYVQTPGFSEHHTGLCVDVSIFNADDGSSEDFDGTGKYEWFSKNAWKYGFVVRYPEGKEKVTKIGYEPWHFRYVGVPHAYYMTKNGLCLEEYIELLQSKTKSEPLKFRCGAKTYKVWHSKQKPKKGNFSGDNYNGYIIWK
ncbi:MAG: M15 family metallopeptidase [Clostridia bacterium]|nr:M15 family metallopeptidase [Clostridia bacterium]